MLFGDIIGVFVAVTVFILPFAFMFVNSLKDRREANLLQISLPKVFQWSNYTEVLNLHNHIVLTAFKNSMLLSLLSVCVLVITCSMTGYLIQRRKSRYTKMISVMMMIGLIMPPAIMPTIWLMQGLHIYKTMFGMILIETALQTPFTVMLYRGYIGSVPRELEEAGRIDGCGKWNMFSKIVFPLLKPVTSTVIILDAVTVFCDFTNPLYFLPGLRNATVQLTLYSFMGQYSSSYNMLFADAIIITIPMLVLFLIFNKKIVDGMVAGAIKA